MTLLHLIISLLHIHLAVKTQINIINRAVRKVESIVCGDERSIGVIFMPKNIADARATREIVINLVPLKNDVGGWRPQSIELSCEIECARQFLGMRDGCA